MEETGEIQEVPVVSDDERLRGRIWAAISYFGILFILIGFLVQGGNRLVRFHLKQSLLLFLYQIVSGLVVALAKHAQNPFTVRVALVVLLAYVASILFLVIYGVTNAWSGRLQPLPIIGKLLR